MTEARPADLVYGHLGEAVYDTDSQEWKFTRRPCIGKGDRLCRSLSVDLCRPTAQAYRAANGCF